MHKKKVKNVEVLAHALQQARIPDNPAALVGRRYYLRLGSHGHGNILVGKLEAVALSDTETLSLYVSPSHWCGGSLDRIEYDSVKRRWNVVLAPAGFSSREREVYKIKFKLLA